MNRKNTSITPTVSEMEAALRAAPETAVPDPDNPPFPDDFMERAFRTSSSEEMLEKLAEMRQRRTERAAAARGAVPRRSRVQPALVAAKA
ncbi:MAG: hypothetical protein J6T92_00570 [Ottowia sp.]|nr:hypothetical protein [Ottowia sp.]